ncbi:MAG: GNAT family acetyltransferase [Thermodesulfobacteriota bacterium]|nr:MAG: GNAT family acetyltransferase [Thermodesulfobacteriota bacterium]
MNEFEVLQVSWFDMESQLRAIRTQVFIEEQNVPVELEWDEADIDCIHLLVKKGSNYIATSRFLNTGQIGRMAVLKPYRHRGIGNAMLKKILIIAHSMDMNTVFLNAQLDAVDFYKKNGFIKQGDIFDDAGIPHLRMEKKI